VLGVSELVPSLLGLRLGLGQGLSRLRQTPLEVIDLRTGALDVTLAGSQSRLGSGLLPLGATELRLLDFEGGLEGRPANMIFYATSNRRHLLPRDMMENERSTAINPSEAVQEKVSLSDRFGLWLGFHNCSQDEFFAMIEGYLAHHGLKVAPAEWRAAAIEWSTTRGSRSGRVAWQFVQDLAGRMGEKLD